jgi:hypothetical protein
LYFASKPNKTNTHKKIKLNTKVKESRGHRDDTKALDYKSGGLISAPEMSSAVRALAFRRNRRN